MSGERAEGGITRRDFLRRAAGAALAAGIGVPALVRADAAKERAGGMKYRTLGRTKLKVSELGMGCIKIDNPAVVHRALDLGITYFDTAEGYQGGNSEIKLGKALKGRRDEAIVATKWEPWRRQTVAEFVKACDDSLKRLGMDHIDLIQIHGAGNAEQVNNDVLCEAFDQLKAAGKVRFNGVSVHENQAEVIDAVIKNGRYDEVLCVYNALNGEGMRPVIKRAHDAGLGIVIMKALAPAHEGRAGDVFRDVPGSPYQQSIRWVLQDPNVSTVIVDMPTFDELEEDAQAALSPGHRAELEAFERAVGKMAMGTCHLCGECTGQCPRGVRVAEVMRYLLYHDGYGDRARAAGLYREMDPRARAAACGECDGCRVACPWGVPVRAKMERAHAVLA
jgi:hypothetical protein